MDAREVSELKELWKRSFGDSSQYTDFYFSRRYRTGNTRVFRADGKIVSSAQFFPYDISCGKDIIKGVYILGVCTHPDYRRRGFVSRMIREILEEQAVGGAELAFLIPSERELFGLYEKLGFAGLFTVYEGHVEAVAATTGEYEIMTPAPDDLFRFYSRFYASLHSAVLKTKDDFLFAIEDFIAYGGRIDACGINGKIRGFAATEGDIVKELLCVDAEARDTLLSHLLSDAAGGLTVITPNPQPGAVKKTIGMARALRSDLPICAVKDPYANLLLN